LKTSASTGMWYVCPFQVCFPNFISLHLKYQVTQCVCVCQRFWMCLYCLTASFVFIICCMVFLFYWTIKPFWGRDVAHW
jgi:hypothetical protein